VVDCGRSDPTAKEATRPEVVVEVFPPGAPVIDLIDRVDEYQFYHEIQVIMLVEPNVISVKIYRRNMHGLLAAERYNELDQAVDLPEVNSSIRLGDIYDTLKPKTRPRLQP
jgi:Uma2 family endonuclease